MVAGKPPETMPDGLTRRAEVAAGFGLLPQSGPEKRGEVAHASSTSRPYFIHLSDPTHRASFCLCLTPCNVTALFCIRAAANPQLLHGRYYT